MHILCAENLVLAVPAFLSLTSSCPSPPLPYHFPLPQPHGPGFHPRPSFCSPVPSLPKANSGQPNTHPRAHNATGLCAQYLLPESFLPLSNSKGTSPTPPCGGSGGHLIASCYRLGSVLLLLHPGISHYPPPIYILVMILTIFPAFTCPTMYPTS